MAEAVAIVLDIGPHMLFSVDGDPPIKCATECLKMLLQRKLFAESKDEFCLVLCGTDEAINDLADEDGNFAHISMDRPLGRLNWDMLERLNNGIEVTEFEADVIDGVIVGVDHLVHQTNGKKGIKGKRVVLISNLDAEINADELGKVIKNLKRAEVEFNLIGADLNDTTDDDAIDRPALDGAAANPNPPRGNGKTKTQLANEKIMVKILEALEGESYSFEETIPALSFFETRGVLQRAWKADLEISEDLSIPCNGYTKVKSAKPKSMTNVYARDPQAQIKIARTYHKNDEAQTEVSDEDTVKGYRYGSTLVPFSEEDTENMKLKSEKCLKVIGFTSAENVPRHLYMGDNVMALVAENEGGAQALSALIHALFETNRVALVRRVYNRIAAPRLGVLTPKIRAGYETLEYTELAFAEDLRTFTFPSLPVPGSSAGEGVGVKHRPSADQMDCVDRLIDAMMLAPEEKSDDTQEEGGEELMKPKELLNPYIQRMYQCVQARTLDPQAPLPEPSPLVNATLEPPEERAREAQPHVEEAIGLFPLRRREVAKKTTTAGEMFKEEDGDGTTKPKRPRLDDDNEISLGGLARVQVTEVGSVDPEGDFRAMLDRGLTKEACEQMVRRIMQMVADSYQDDYYSKAIACLRTLRDACIRHSLPHVFNQFLEDWKQTLNRPGAAKKDFWTRLCRESVSLIHVEEASTSKVSRASAESFLQAEDHTTKDAGPDNDVDDLLADMD